MYIMSNQYLHIDANGVKFEFSNTPTENPRVLYDSETGYGCVTYELDGNEYIRDFLVAGGCITFTKEVP